MKKPRYNEKTDRNNEIYQDRLSGLSWYQLSIKYGLHVKTLWNIVKRMNQRANNEDTQKSN